MGTRRSKLRAKLRFYFTDAFLSMPAPQPLPAPADSAAPVAVSDHSDQPPSVEMQRPTSGSGDAQPAADRRAAVDGPTAAVRPSTGTEAIPGEAVANRSKPSEGWSGAPQSPPHHAKRGVMGAASFPRGMCLVRHTFSPNIQCPSLSSRSSLMMACLDRATRLTQIEKNEACAKYPLADVFYVPRG